MRSSAAANAGIGIERGRVEHDGVVGAASSGAVRRAAVARVAFLHVLQDALVYSPDAARLQLLESALGPGLERWR